MTLFHEITLAVVLALGAAVVVEYFRSRKAKDRGGDEGCRGTNEGGRRGFRFTVKFDKH